MTGAEVTITFLGTGSAIPPNSRQQSSFCVRHPNGLVIFDCGEGTQYALRKLSISTRKELVIWISHLHSDHFLGLPGLLASFALLDRKEEIVIVGPIGLHRTVENLIIANYIKTPYDIKVVELEPGDVFDGSGYTMHSISANHDANALSVLWLEDTIPGKVDIETAKSMGISPGPQIGKLQSGESIVMQDKTILPDMIIGEERPGRSIMYSGDTASNMALAELRKKPDILVHEATYPSDMIELASERQHSTFKQAAQIAKIINPGKLVLTHISPRVLNLEEELKEVKQIFEKSIIAKQGLELKLPYPYHND